MAAFALIGAGLGLGLGAVYLAAGLGEVAADHARAERRQAALAVAFAPPAATSGTYDLIDPKRPAPQAAAPRSFAPRGADLDCLTAAVYFEARGETRRGQAAVAQVVLNRVLHPAFPHTVCGVVYQGADTHSCQFSFACDGIADVGRETAAWREARQVAVRALAGGGDSDVGSATHFHAVGVAPAWESQMFRVAQIGLHVFYRLRPPGSAPAAPTSAAKEDKAILASAVAPQPKIALLDEMPAQPKAAAKPPVDAAPAAPAAGPELAVEAEPRPAPPAAAPEAAGRKPG